MNDISTLLETTLDYVTGLIPGAEKTTKKKRKHTSQKPNKKKRKKQTWGSYVKSATDNLNDFYDSVSSSLGLFRLSKSEKDDEPEDDDMAEAFFAELIAAEVVEKMTLGIVDIVSSNFDDNKK